METVENIGTRQPDRGGAAQGRYDVGGAPRVMEQPHPEGVPVRVERRLRVEEIDIRAHSAEDQLGGEQVEAFIPGEGEGLRVEEQAGGDEGDQGWQIDAFAGQTYILACLIDLKVLESGGCEALYDLKLH
jgi:hypothetical protein